MKLLQKRNQEKPSEEERQLETKESVEDANGAGETENDEYTGTVIIKNEEKPINNQVLSELEVFIKQYKEANKEMDRKKEADKEVEDYYENSEKLKQIEEALNLDPKVKIKDVEKTIGNLEKQFEDEIKRIKNKYEPVIDTLNQYVELKKKIKHGEKQLKEMGVEWKKKGLKKKAKSKNQLEKNHVKKIKPKEKSK